METAALKRESWEIVCRTDQVTAEDPYAAEINGLSIGVFRTEQGLQAVDNICPHEYALLTKGWREGGVVECPLHEAKFCLKSGECLQGPTTLPVTVYSVREDNGQISVLIPNA
jgi:nitrite reductase/ring-hydroxylating ferredoxin subunit